MERGNSNSVSKRLRAARDGAVF